LKGCLVKSLAQRDRQAELMDQPGLATAVHQKALRALGRTNAWSRTSGALWRGLQDAGVFSIASRPIRLLDIASGGGDNAIGLSRIAQRRGISLEAHGCDISATAVAHATEVAARADLPRVAFFQLNALESELPSGYDVVMCTLFLHHLTEEDGVDLLRRMASAARVCVLVDDLLRSRLGYMLAWAGARLLTRSHIVQIDGPLSVRSAYSVAEARSVAERAGLQGAAFRRHWPERFLLTWKKS
jgi:2-polyprenyl-3-methyl-5-hydroxy-6-metoxy-1,4-benzoquinol methylase